MYEFDKDNVEKVVIRIISDLGIPNESVVVPLQTAFLAMANQARLTTIPQLTIDTSVLENV